MFVLLAGLVLPPAREAEALARRPELWRHVAHELSEQFAAVRSSCPCALWICCADGRPPPSALSGAIAALAAGLPAHVRLDPALEPGDPLRWLQASPVVVLLDFEPHLPSDDRSVERLRHQRLRGALAAQATIALTLPRTGDGLVDRADRYAGAAALPPEQDVRPGQGLARYARAWRGARQELSDQAPESCLTRKGWETDLAVAWALGQSRALLGRSDRRLLAKALALALGLVLVAPWLHQLTPRFIPGVLLGAAGAVGLSIQPLRQRAQQWWCLAQALWVQDSWHRFGLGEAVAEQLPQRQPLDSAREPGQLRHLLCCHALALALEEPPPAWGRGELADAIEGLQQHCRQVDTTLRRRQGERRLMLLPALVCVLLLLGAGLTNAVLIKQAILAVGTALVALWLHRPLPLVRSERLLRHLRVLEGELPDLRRGLTGADLGEPNLRASLLASIQRVGAELIDLANDALEASSWSWTFTP